MNTCVIPIIELRTVEEEEDRMSVVTQPYIQCLLAKVLLKRQ